MGWTPVRTRTGDDPLTGRHGETTRQWMRVWFDAGANINSANRTGYAVGPCRGGRFQGSRYAARYQRGQSHPEKPAWADAGTNCCGDPSSRSCRNSAPSADTFEVTISLRLMAGSLRASSRPISKRRKRCSTDWHELPISDYMRSGTVETACRRAAAGLPRGAPCNKFRMLATVAL